jgi:hypothetical protein
MKFTKKEFAESTGQTTSSLAVYIRRGKVVVGKDGMIDDSNSINKQFIYTYAHKKVEKRVPMEASLPKVVRMPVDVDDEDMDGDEGGEDSEGVPGLHVSEKRYKAALANKTQKQDEMLRLQIAKQKGLLIPSALVMPLFMQHNQFLLNEQRNADEELLLLIAHKAGISDEDVAWMRAEWIRRRNKAVEDATDMSENGLDQVIESVMDRKK